MVMCSSIAAYCSIDNRTKYTKAQCHSERERGISACENLCVQAEILTPGFAGLRMIPYGYVLIVFICG